MKSTKSARRRKPAADPSAATALRWLHLLRQLSDLEDAVQDAVEAGALGEVAAEAVGLHLEDVWSEMISGAPI